jgi:uncharacterized protein YaeQ
MSTGSLLHRFQIDLADSDRGVYEEVDLRVACHASETGTYLVVRVLAYCLAYAPGIALSNGVSSGDEAAISIVDDIGRTTTLIEIGYPSSERLHRATKLAPRVLVFPHKELEPWMSDLRAARIHAPERIEIVRFARPFVEAVQRTLERGQKWSVSIHDGHVYVVKGDTSLDSEIERLRLDP